MVPIPVLLVMCLVCLKKIHLIYGTCTGTSGDVFSLSEKIHLIYCTYTGTSNLVADIEGGT